jgi:hypothetical protein
MASASCWVVAQLLTSITNHQYLTMTPRARKWLKCWWEFTGLFGSIFNISWPKPIAQDFNFSHVFRSTGPWGNFISTCVGSMVTSSRCSIRNIYASHTSPQWSWGATCSTGTMQKHNDRCTASWGGIWVLSRKIVKLTVLRYSLFKRWSLFTQTR